MGSEHSDQDCQNALIPDWQKSCQNDRFLIGFPPWFGWAFKTAKNALIQDWKKSCQNDRFLIGFLSGFPVLRFHIQWFPVWHFFIFFFLVRANLR